MANDRYEVVLAGEDGGQTGGGGQTEGGGGSAGSGGVGRYSVVVTEEMLQPMVLSVRTNITSMLPVLLSLFGMIVAVGMIPNLIRKFTGR